MRVEIHTSQSPLTGTEAPALSEAWHAGASVVVLALQESSGVLASCAVWEKALPDLAGRRVGYIGQFHCAEGAAASPVLEAACHWLAREGCQVAVGPLDGSTWHPYRLVTESFGEPPFAMEPTNPPEWPEWWMGAGFRPLAKYHSSINDDITRPDPLREAAMSRATKAGLTIRPLNLAVFDRELRAIYELSLTAFADNFLYSPIAWEEFAAMYAPMEHLLDPRLVLLCDDPSRPGALAGYIMAFPDLLEQRRTGRCSTVILKSLAVHANWRSVRLGSWLVSQAQANAALLGMRRSIFALMHDANHSARIGKHYSRVIRRYTLFAREIGP